MTSESEGGVDRIAEDAGRLEDAVLAEVVSETERPNLARATNYLVGGGANFAADREAVHQMMALDPDIGRRTRAARAFVGRAVRFARDRGCDQFLELGSGIASPGGLHPLLGQAEARVVHVDVDPVAVEHTRDLLADRKDAGPTAIVQGDLRDSDRVLDAARWTGLLDTDRPVAVVCSSVLQWLADSDTEQLAAVFDAYHDALVPGSLLVITVPHPDALPAPEIDLAQAIVERHVAPIRLRRRTALARIVARWEVQEPGIVDVVDWPTGTGVAPVGFYGVVGVRR